MSQHSELLPLYKHLRQVAMQVNHRLVKSMPKDVLEEGGKTLGIFRDNIFVFQSEDMSSVLMDFCIHDVRRQGKTVVERYLAETPPPPDSDEMKILQALVKARYSLFVVEATEPGVGVQVRDLLRDEPLFLMDVSFGNSAVPGLVLATRVKAFEDVAQTTGAALPLGVLPEEGWAMLIQGLQKIFKTEDLGRLPPEKASRLAASIIHSCLATGVAEQIHYDEPGASRPVGGPTPARLPFREPTVSQTTRHVGRNDPCPCGSGKKFKKCCGAPR